MSTVDLYDVLNLKSDCTKKDIKKAYRSLAKKFHPDKGGDEELFELITHAYNILGNEKSRGEYDKIFELSSQSAHSHVGLKEGFESYQNAQKTSVVKKSDEEIEREMKKMQEEFDRKHNLDRTKVGAFDPKELDELVEDLELAQKQDDIELSHENLFEGKTFDPATFNAMFDKMREKGQIGSLIPHEGNPGAWNAGGDNYSSYDTTYDKLYAENDGDELDFDGSSIHQLKKDSVYAKPNKGDLKNLKPADYTKNHNKVDDKYNKSLDQLIAERNLETHKLHHLEMDQYETSTGDYGVFDKLGLDPTAGSIVWENEETVKEKYQKLLEQRQVPVPPKDND